MRAIIDDQPLASPAKEKAAVFAADVLAGRKTAGELTGQVLVGGKPPSRTFMRRYTGYVEQFGKAILNSCLLSIQHLPLRR